MKRIINIAVCAIAIIGIISCVKKFEDMNTPPFGVSDEELTQDNNFIGMHFPSIQQSIYYNYGGGGWGFQVIQNLNSDIWSGYMATPSNFKGGVNNQTYFLTNDWNDEAWINTYAIVMTNQLMVREKSEQIGLDVYGHFNAINTILRVLAMSRVVDEYGPIIYSKYGESKTGGTYDSAEEAYTSFFRELSEATETLASFLNKPAASFKNFDMAYDGHLDKWMRLSNTLRLRLALRVVKYDQDWARAEAEKAIKAPQGVMQKGDDFTISGFGWKHPLYTTSILYNDIFVSANMHSILTGYGDPRLPMIGIAKGDRVIGVRAGLPDLDVLGDQYKSIISHINVDDDTPARIVSASEAYFLLAEAALRGWDTQGGTAQSFYETGIAVSFDEFSVSMGDYLSNTNQPQDWIDPLRADFNTPAASTISPAWSDAQTDEERLEKIITQKWIGGFPEGKNAWAEWRRTGYPKLFPVLKNDSQGIISTEHGVRRMPFPLREQRDNPTGYANAVQLLRGPDNGATRLFWDVAKPNL